MEHMMSEPWKDKYFDKMFSDLAAAIDDVKGDIKANTKLTQEVSKKQDYTNGRVNKLEGVVFPEAKIQKRDLPPIYRDPKVIQVAVYLSLALLILVGAATRFDVARLLP